MLMMVLRLNRSATCPTTSVSRSIGKNCTSPTMPRANVLCVSAYTCQPTATAVTWNDIVEHIRADQNRTYAGSRNTDLASMGCSGSGMTLLFHVHPQTQDASTLLGGRDVGYHSPLAATRSDPKPFSRSSQSEHDPQPINIASNPA